jgi:hypothetical protein
MTEYTQEEAVFRMNEMGKAGRPFLFIIDYKRERIYVEFRGVCPFIRDRFPAYPCG